MKIPTTIKILGLNYQVVVTDDFANVIKPQLNLKDSLRRTVEWLLVNDKWLGLK